MSVADLPDVHQDAEEWTRGSVDVVVAGWNNIRDAVVVVLHWWGSQYMLSPSETLHGAVVTEVVPAAVLCSMCVVRVLSAAPMFPLN